MEAAGSRTVADLIIKHRNSTNPIDCIVYDPFMPWVLDVAKQFGLVCAAFFTQTCAVNYVYYLLHHGLLKLPIPSTPVSISGFPLLDLHDMPSFNYVQGQYPAYFEMVLNQFSNTDGADFVLVNSFYKLEDEVVDSMCKHCPILTIGPSIYLDNRNPDDKDYGLNLFTSNASVCSNWLDSKPPGSVVYVSFGSMSSLSDNQIEELAFGLKQSKFYFLWVVRDSKLPNGFVDGIGDKGLLVQWCSQLEMFSNTWWLEFNH